MKDVSLDEILEKIINKELSLRQASRISGISRDLLRVELVRKFANDKEKLDLIEKIMQDNKINSTTIDIEKDKLEEVFFKVVNREITLGEAQIELGNIDIETLKEKLAGLVGDSQNLEIAQKYSDYMQNRIQDYSGINFRKVAISMMRSNCTQIEMAEELGMTPRALSREFEKLSADKDTRLYDLLKMYCDLKMKRHKFTDIEIERLEMILSNYEQNFQELLKEPKKTKSQIAREKEDYLVRESEKLKAKGLTQKQIADILETSVSTLRRARLSKQNRDRLQKISENIEEESK